MIALNIFVIGVLLGQCTPMEKSWKPDVDGTCLPTGFLDYGGRVQSSKCVLQGYSLVIRRIDAVHSLECDYGSRDCGLSSVHDLEATDEE